jgi:hypothetical protein
MSITKAKEDINFLDDEQANAKENLLQVYNPYSSANLEKNFKKSLKLTNYYKKFDEDSTSDLELPPVKTKQNQKNIKLPKFLRENPFKIYSKSNLEKNLNDLVDPVTENPEAQNINSIASVFSKDHEEVEGLRRVFKKSLSFLIIHLTLFLALSLSGLFFFSLNPLLTMGTAILYIVFTNIFFIIVADKSYVFVALLAQFILLIFANSLFGLGFSAVTLLITSIIVLFNYLAYSELEKIQLSSRLFSISHITAESTRILLTSMTLVFSLGVFNSIISEKSTNFIERVFLDNPFIMENFIIDGTSPTSANRYLMGGRFFVDASDNVKYFDRNTATIRTATYRDFLKENYRTSDVLTSGEIQLIRSSCETGFNSLECNQRVISRENELLSEWDKEAYSELRTKRGLNLKLEDTLDRRTLEVLTKQLYENEITRFESVESGNDLIPEWLLLVPLSNIIPAFFAIGVYFFLFLIRFFISWISTILSIIIWSFLKWAGVVQIDIETVESEIVTI